MKKIVMKIVIIAISFCLCDATANGLPADTGIAEEYQRYCEEIGDMYCICPELLVAMIEAESSGNPDATNGTCKGLMQVSDRWHRDRMERLGVTDIYDPYGNILVAADYLLELFEKYEDVGMVLMVYNGDSRAKEFSEGREELSVYASRILARAEMLERMEQEHE